MSVPPKRMVTIVPWVVLAILVSLVIVFGCSEESGSSMGTSVASEVEIAASEWEALQGITVLFGHQSVGQNIMKGVEEVASDEAVVGFSLCEGAKAGSDPCLYHFRAGENGHPRTKIDALINAVRESESGDLIYAGVKFCYVDLTDGRDAEQLFRAYQEFVESLQERYPGVVLFHITTPLTTNPGGFKTRLKVLLGKRDLWEYADNIVRNDYNELLRAEYSSRGRLFDLARVESTWPDGSRETFELDGAEYEALVPSYTDDGGHLNPQGRQRVARYFLRFIADLAIQQ